MPAAAAAGAPQLEQGQDDAAEGAAGAAVDGALKPPPEQFKVLYRFNEGYTNAVKRPLLMAELL